MHLQPIDPHSMLKPILVMALMCWGLLTVALTDHPHPHSTPVAQEAQ